MERGTDSLSVSTSYTILHQYRLIWRDIRSLSLRIFMYSLFIVHLISILKTRILYKEKEPRKRKVEDRVIRTPNLLIWNQTRYRCAMPSFQLTSFLSIFKTWNGLSVTLKLRIPTLDTTEYHKQFKRQTQPTGIRTNIKESYCTHIKTSTSLLITNTTSKLHITRHDSHTLGMNSAQICILKQRHKISLSSLLKSHHGRTLETEIILKVLSNLTD